MSFLDQGTAVIPVVKSDDRSFPASIPPAADEWAAQDVNQIRQALLDLRDAALAIESALGSGILYAYGPGFAIVGRRTQPEVALVHDAVAVAKA